MAAFLLDAWRDSNTAEKALWVSAFAAIISAEAAAAAIFNYRHARNLFRYTQYPDLEIIPTIPVRDGTAIVVVGLRNLTNVKAIDIQIKTTIRKANGWPTSWKQNFQIEVPPSETLYIELDAEPFALTLTHSFPDNTRLTVNAPGLSIALIPGQLAPSFPFKLGVTWRAPIWKSDKIRRRWYGFVKTTIDAGGILNYELQKRSALKYYSR